MNDSTKPAPGHDMMSQIFQKLRKRNWKGTLRLVTFAAPDKFSRPRNTAEATARLQINLGYYFTNYIVLSCLIFLLYLMTSPVMLIVTAILTGMWVFIFKYEPLRIGQFQIAGKNKMIGGSAISVAAIFLFVGGAVFMILGISACIITLHSVFHTTICSADRKADGAVDSVIDHDGKCLDDVELANNLEDMERGNDTSGQGINTPQ